MPVGRPTRPTIDNGLWQHGGTTVVELFMAPGDLGRVIGRQGRTATAMRTLFALAAEQAGKKATLEFRDEPGAGARRR